MDHLPRCINQEAFRANIKEVSRLHVAAEPFSPSALHQLSVLVLTRLSKHNLPLRLSKDWAGQAHRTAITVVV